MFKCSMDKSSYKKSQKCSPDVEKQKKDETKSTEVAVCFVPNLEEDSASTRKSDGLGSNLKWKFILVTTNIVVALALLISLLVWFFQIGMPTAVEHLSNSPSTESDNECIPLRIPLCQKYRVSYSYTAITVGHHSQIEANDAISRYEPLVSVKCYALLPLFLCSLHVPKCIEGGRVVPPCRSLCEDARRKCDFFLGVFTLYWPLDMDCQSLPESPDPDICVGYEERKQLQRVALACQGGFRCDKERCIPKKWLCDGYFDCKDHTDEKENCSNCSRNEFFCDSNSCIGKSRVCDGIVDCADGRDERRCLRLSREMKEQGQGRLEAFNASVANWQPVCGEDWQDEMSSKACTALGYSQVEETRLRDGTTYAHNRVAVVEFPKPSLHSVFSKKNCIEDNVQVFLKCDNFGCGSTVRSNGGSSWRIVGGSETVPGTWPWLVAMHGGPDEVFFCGGVLISSSWVLTAAHCIGNQTDASGWKLTLGMTRRTTSWSYTKTRGLRGIVKHPDFSSTSLYSNDVALLLLDTPVDFDDYLRPVCLPPKDMPLHAGLICTVIGWGKPYHDEDAEYQTVIHEVEVPLVEFPTCAQWYSSQDVILSDTMLCAGYAEGKKDACQGDSGGPLLCQVPESGKWAVVGVVSWGIKCAQPNLPGIYTNVPMYMDWIRQTAKEHGQPLYLQEEELLS